MPTPLRVLFVEDSANDVGLMLAVLRQADFDPLPEQVDTVAGLHQALAAGPWDVILCDYSVPDCEASTVLQLIRQSGVEIPVIIVSGHVGEQAMVAAMKLGAMDCLLKDRLARLGPAVRNAMEHRQLQRQQSQTLAELTLFRQLVDQSNDTIEVIDPATGRYLDVNGKGPAELGCTREEYLSLRVCDIDPMFTEASWVQLADAIHQTGSLSGEGVHRRKDGTIFPIEFNAKWVQGERDYIVTVVRNITERKKAEKERLRQASFAHFNPNPVLELSASGTITYANTATGEMAKSLGQSDPEQIMPPDTALIVRECLVTDTPRLRVETHCKGRTISWSFFPIRAMAVVHCYGGDITARQQLEERLRQSQKMEAIGQLSGGVAHDFNNLLTVMRGYIGLLRIKGQVLPDIAEAIQQIDEAASRASNLTRQLLTFSRQQVMQPADLNLNGLVHNLTKMLRRLVPESIEMKVECAAQALPIRVDEGMVEQVLVNLVVNARDAMPKTGTLHIRTRPVHFDEAAALLIPPVRSGTFACLEVTDTGAGMPPEVVAHIFEPFFTTKGVGKGTGLGLATVYGIMEQHEGWIEVATQPGSGTTFRAYFPFYVPVWSEKKTLEQDEAVQGGHEGILLVEDEQTVRDVAEVALRGLGYRVFTAVDGLNALQVWELNKHQIDLLLTDLVMPGGLSGRDLALRLLDGTPQLPVVYMSGYSNEVTGSGFPFKAGIIYLPKPFDLAGLAKSVRNGLDRGGAPVRVPPAIP